MSRTTINKKKPALPAPHTRPPTIIDRRRQALFQEGRAARAEDDDGAAGAAIGRDGVTLFS